MNTTHTAEELVESWVNGNREFVVDVLMDNPRCLLAGFISYGLETGGMGDGYDLGLLIRLLAERE